MSLTELSQIIARLPQQVHENLLVGTEHADDAAVYKLNDEIALIQTIDIFTPVVDDPYKFGQIAAANALSDVYAMGGRPLTALNFIGYPTKDLELETVVEILKGGADKTKESGALVVGGHSIMDPELKYGLAVTGVVHPDRIVTNAGAQADDVLVLTKPVGTGILSTALKSGKAGAEVENIICGVMTALNKVPSEIMKEFRVNACTDVTGFGLLGHAYEMAKGSGVRFRIHHKNVPVIPGALEMCKKGTVPGGSYTNREFLVDKVTFHDAFSEEEQLILYDAQTSGGLLIAVAQTDADDLVKRLRDAGIRDTSIIGEVVEGTAGTIEISE